MTAPRSSVPTASDKPEYRAWFESLRDSSERYGLDEIVYTDSEGGLLQVVHDMDELRKTPGDEWKKLNELEQLYRTKLEIDAHYTLQQTLRWWLYFHVPTSLLLLACVLVHIFVVWYY